MSGAPEAPLTEFLAHVAPSTRVWTPPRYGRGEPIADRGGGGGAQGMDVGGRWLQGSEGQTQEAWTVAPPSSSHQHCLTPCGPCTGRVQLSPSGNLCRSETSRPPGSV